MFGPCILITSIRWQFLYRSSSGLAYWLLESLVSRPEVCESHLCISIELWFVWIQKNEYRIDRCFRKYTLDKFMKYIFVVSVAYSHLSCYDISGSFYDWWTPHIRLGAAHALFLQWGVQGCCTVYPKEYTHGFDMLCFVVVMQSFIMNPREIFIHIHQGCFAGTGAIVRLPQCQWSKPDGYGKVSQCITTTKHNKAKTLCIFLGIYCMNVDIF